MSGNPVAPHDSFGSFSPVSSVGNSGALLRVSAIVFDLDNTLIDTVGADKCAFERVHSTLHSNYPVFPHPSHVTDTFKMLLSSGAELMSVDCDDIDNSASSTSTSSSAKQKSCHEMRFEMWCEAVERNIPPDSNAKKSLDPSRIAALCNSVWSKTRAAGFNIAPQDAILLERLKQRGFKLAILTNGPKDVQQIKVNSVLDHLSPGIFDCVVISGEYSIHKPDPRIFETVTQQLNTTPSQTAIVGDSPDTDILGGNFAGWKTIWFNPDKRVCDSLSRKPHVEIQSLSDLALVIDLNHAPQKAL